jgi:Cu(I)/Ag(I) efflux system membrane protein CusA/SilA
MIARIIEYCAKNRFLVFMGTSFAVAAAVWAIRTTPLDAIPDLSDPQVIIFTEWMGRSPPLVEDQITYPIVTSLLAAPHVTDVRGLSMFGMSFIYVLFEEGTDLYWARSRVLEYMSSIRGRLPPGVNPVLGPDATSVGWGFQYALSDTTGQNDLAQLRTFQDFTLRYALASVPGVAEVASVGGYERQYQVTVDPARLRAYGISLLDVSRAIRRSNNDVGGRVLEMSGREYYVRGRGYVQDLGALERVVVGVGPGGAPILIRDIGEVRFGGDIRRGIGELNGEGEAVGAVVVVRFGENTHEVIQRVKKKLEELKPSFPKGVEYTIVYDRTDLIDRAVETLKSTLLEEGIVVAVIILLFLLHFRSALVPIIVLPIGVALSFLAMKGLGLTSNIMSLGGIAIAIGAMVDAAIVIIENCHKHLEKLKPGEDRQRALIEAAKEVGPAIFFSLLIITVSFLPIFTLEGQAGRLFKPLAYTKTFAMLFAALLSITLVPPLLNTFVRGRIFHESRHPISRFLIFLYKPFVFVALRNPKTTVAMGIFAVVSAIPLVFKLGSEFMPPLNEGDILYMPTTLPNLSIEEAKKSLQIQDRILRRFPEVEAVFGKTGRVESATDPAPLSMVETVVKLKPVSQWRKVREERWYSSWAPDWLKRALGAVWPEERPKTWEELTAEMNKALQLPGWTNAMTMPIKTRVDMLSTGVRTPIGIKVFGTDLEALEKVGVTLEGLLTPLEGTRSAFYERSTGGYYIDIVPRREELARYGLTVGDLQDVIEAAVGGLPVSTTVEGRNRFSINVRYPRDLREDVNRIQQIVIPVKTMNAAPAAESEMGMGGALGIPDVTVGPALAQAMGEMAPQGPSAPGVPSFGGPARLDTGAAMSAPAPMGAPMPAAGMGGGPGRPGWTPLAGAASLPQIPLGQVAEVKVASGPPMIRDENGMLVGYVYVDIDTGKRDIGGYVTEAKGVVQKAIQSGTLQLPTGYYLKWTGQYELLEKMMDRMKIVLPVTLVLILVLLYLHFRNVTEVIIVLLSIPFALVGSVWLLWLLDYRISTAVWVGIIALVGLAAQTGIVMIVYLDHAYAKRKAAGKIRDLNDIIWAHMEGTVQRVRPKLMTVATMMIGLVPLLWSVGTGAEAMKRMAAPMVGGLITSAFLTLEIIPVVYTYWRLAQIKREKKRLAREKK